MFGLGQTGPAGGSSGFSDKKGEILGSNKHRVSKVPLTINLNVVAKKSFLSKGEQNIRRATKCFR